MFSRLFTNKRVAVMPLGRWGAVIRNTKKDNKLHRENSIEFNTDWANHDHCGGEMCQKVIPLKKNLKHDKNITKVAPM